MKKAFFIILFGMTLGLTANAQEINQVDANGKRTGLWKKKYQNNRVRYVGTFKNGKEIDTFKFYSAKHSKFPVIVKVFNAINNDAKVTFYNVDSGAKESQGLMRGKLREGKWMYYQPNGKSILTEENYKNGKLDGAYKVYYKTGKPAELSNYKNGKRHGNFKRYSDENILIEDINYQNGRLHGMSKSYDLKGNLTAEGNYTNGKKTGNWNFYENGQAVSEKEFLDDN